MQRCTLLRLLALLVLLSLSLVLVHAQAQPSQASSSRRKLLLARPDNRSAEVVVHGKECAHNKTHVKCKVNPCKHKHCHKHETCVAVHGCDSCKAICVKKQHVHSNNATASNHTTTNTTTGAASNNTHGASNSGHEATNQTRNGACPDGSQPVECLYDPCVAATCLAGTVCQSDYCGGCNAVCKTQNNTESVSPAPAQTSCPDGSQPVPCLIDPCRTKTCGQGELCQSDYCGGCNAVCKAPTTTTPCKDGSRPVPCLIDPCRTKTCGQGELCQSDYCGGCNAVCTKKP